MFYKYIIKFDGAEEKVIDIQLDPVTLNLLPKKDGDFPQWTLLDYGKCSVCPYDGASQKYCPLALNLAHVTKMFSDKSSTMTVDVRVVSREREYFKRTSLQTALSSAIGIYMVTSGCPVMDILKPMVRYHLPFASLNETVNKSVSSYLLQQYLRKKEGLEPDWELKKLSKAYENIEILNRAIVGRIRKVSEKDANCNAVIILDVFAKMVPRRIGQSIPVKEFLLHE
ncbi:MAG: hypothetical protein NTX59_04835 [Elusimicrobia bacterium]|nr:hypothetical protein [Elusimicrobiota bacterium]